MRTGRPTRWRRKPRGGGGRVSGCWRPAREWPKGIRTSGQAVVSLERASARARWPAAPPAIQVPSWLVAPEIEIARRSRGYSDGGRCRAAALRAGGCMLSYPALGAEWHGRNDMLAVGAHPGHSHAYRTALARFVEEDVVDTYAHGQKSDAYR